MFNHAVQVQEQSLTEGLAAALSRWADDPGLGDLARANADRLLVLDGEGGRVIHAGPAATGLAADWTAADGRLRTALDLAGQLRRVGALNGRPRLVRLRLDTRGVAPPVTCRIARASLIDGTDVLLIATTGALPPARPSPEPVPPPVSEPMPAEPAPARAPIPHRIVWRSDGEGRLTSVSGPDPSVIEAIRGRSWPELASGADDLLGALHGQRTFRALPLLVPLRETAEAIELDVSGSPSGRDGAATGHAGYALVRGRRAWGEPMLTQTESADEPSGADETVAATDAGPTAGGDDVSAAAADEAEPERSASQDGVTTAGSAVSELEPAPAVDAERFADTPEGHPGPVEDTVTSQGVRSRPVADLSSDERAAFREIARALGARFADEEPDAPPSAAAETMSDADPADSTDRNAAVAAVLENLPACVLVHRDGTPLFANRRLLDLAGVADLTALGADAGGWRSLMQASPADDPPSVSVPSGEGSAPPRLVAERSTLDWDGAPAEILLARPAPDAPPVSEARAEPDPVPNGNGLPDAQVVLDRLEEGVVTLDAGGNVLAMNPKAASILAGAPGEVVGKNFGALFGPDGTAAIDASLRQAREAGASEPREVAGRPGRDSGLPLRLRIARLLAVEESPLCATLQDLAPTKPTQDAETSRLREAGEAARAKLGFFAEAGQGLRAPLGAVRGIADAMLAEQFGPLGNARYRDHVLDIRNAGSEALGLLDGLIDLAQVEAGRLELSLTDLRLNDLVAGCIAEMQPQAARERIVVRTSLSPEVGTLGADERALRRAVLAAVSHAIVGSEPGGQVIVSTTLAERGEALLRVRSTGAGMSAEAIACALDPFGRATRVGASDGLGLALAKALVEAHHGRMRITSRAGEGTLVEMAFPAAQAMSA